MSAGSEAKRWLVRLRAWRLESTLNAIDRAQADLLHEQRFQTGFGGHRAGIKSAERKIARLERKRDKLAATSHTEGTNDG